MKNQAVIVITGSDDPMWPFLRDACTEDEKERIFLYATDLPNRAGLRYCPQKRDSAVFAIELEEISGGNIAGIWMRRIFPPELNNLTPALREYCHKEYRSFLEGLEYCLRSARWVSLPSAINAARSKALQLSLAQDAGFGTLVTSFTNHPKFALGFMSQRQAIYKSIDSPRVPLYPDKHSTVFTTLLQEEDVPKIEGVKACPGIFQEFCDKAADIRVTTIHNSVFAVKIDSQLGQDCRIDFRRGARHVPHTPHDLPKQIADSCLAITKKLDLEFSAIDLALLKDGSYVFFEVNPNGQWGWLEERTGLPMRRALLDYLFYGR